MKVRTQKLARNILQPVFILLILVAFFVSYNVYLVDNSIETLKFSLEETATAQSPIAAEGVSLLLSNALISETPQKIADFKTFNILDFAASVAGEADSTRQLKSAGFAIEEVLAEKEKKRFVVLRWLDTANRYVQRFFYAVKQFFSSLFKKKQTKPIAIVKPELMREAKVLEKKGDFEGAKTAYEEFLLLNESVEGISFMQTRLAFIFMKLGNYAQANDLLSKILDSAANKTEVRIAENLKDQIKRMESLAGKRNQLEEEIKTITKVEDLQEAYFEVGRMNTELYDLKKAQEAFKKTIDLAPDSEIAQTARFNLGFAYKVANNIKASEEVFLKLSKGPVPNVLQVASSIQVASVKKIAKKFREAAQILETVSAEAEDVVTAAIAQFEAGYVYLFNLNDVKKAQEAFDRVSELQARNPNMRLLDTGHVGGVGQSALREYAFVMFEKGDFEKAKDAFETILKTDEDDSWSYAGLGMIYLLEGERKKGYEMANRAYTINPDYYTSSALAYVEEKIGDPERAIQLNKKSIKLNSDYLYPYYNLGHVYIAEKKFKAAADILKKGRNLSIKLGLNFPLLPNNLGLSYYHLGENEKAIEMFNEAIKFAPTLADAWYNRALTYEKMGDKDKYLRDIRVVYRLNPKYKDIEERVHKKAA